MSGPVYCPKVQRVQPTRFTSSGQRAYVSSRIDFHTIKLQNHSTTQLESIFDGDKSLLSLPPVNRRASTARTQKVFTAKRINNRICSASENNQTLVAEERYRCGRAVHESDASLSRHFCELMGPNLCNDCSKQRMQLTCLEEHLESSLTQVESTDPFRDLVNLRGTAKKCKTLGLEEADSCSEQERGFFEGPSTTPADSGFDSRLSYIQSITCCSTPGTTPNSLLNSLWSENARERRHHTRRQRSAEVYNHKDETPPPPAQRPRTTGSTSPLNNNYLAKLCSRDGPFRNNVALLYYPNKRKYAWRGLTVEPVTMDLKFINFTIYDTELKRC